MRIISGILNLVGYCILALFLLGAGLISIAIFFASLVVPVIFLWEWSFIGEEKLRVAEKFLIRDNVYEQMIEVSFSPDRDSQTVIAELRQPSRNFLMNPEISYKMNKKLHEFLWHKISSVFVYAPSSTDIARKQIRAIGQGDIPVELSEQEKAVLERDRFSNKHAALIKHTLPQPAASLVTLENCSVESLENWVCQSSVPFFKGNHTSVANFGDGFVIDFETNTSKFSESRVYDGKIIWWLDNQKCPDICFLGTKKELEESSAEAKKRATELLRAIILKNKADD